MRLDRAPLPDHTKETEVFGIAKQFEMPTNLDIEYKFFGGRLTMKEMMSHLVGLVIAVPVGWGVNSISNNIVLAFMTGIPIQAVWSYLLTRKAFGQVPLFTAIRWRKANQEKTRRLYNYRVKKTKVRR